VEPGPGQTLQAKLVELDREDDERLRRI